MAMVVLTPRNHLLVLLSFLLINIVPTWVTPLSFNYFKFDTGTTSSNSCSNGSKTICLDWDAFVNSDSFIQLTTSQLDKTSNGSRGRAYYSDSLHLWDNSTGNLLVTNFTTTFSFNITKISSVSDITDGIAFFLSPYPSQIEPASGGNLGLVSDANRFTASGNSSFVAVEFDTYTDDWDPPGFHVGIDVNSMRSLTNQSESLPSSSSYYGKATIDYNSATQNLSVYCTWDGVTFSLSHTVPLGSKLPEYVTFGFTGTTCDMTQLGIISSWSFNSTLDDILDARHKPPINITINSSTPVLISPVAAPAPLNEQGRKNNKSRAVLKIVVAVMVTLVGVLCLTWLVVWRIKTWLGGEEKEEEIELHVRYEENNVHPPKFCFSNIRKATDDFAEGKKLGKGGSGAVYRGFLKDVRGEVAIKKIARQDVEQGRKECLAEITTIGQLYHPNLLRLLGWAEKGSVFALVYELMRGGSLDKHLSHGHRVLTWHERYKIARGVASALAYLHAGEDKCFVHRDIKPANILLDENFNAKLGDFGLARFADHGSDLKTTRIWGTKPYIAPDYRRSGKASKESDVYSFGVVALEIATGRTPKEEHGTDLIEWVRNLSGQGDILEAADGKLNQDFDEEEMEVLLKVGLSCAHTNANDRPSIKQVVAALDCFVDLNIN